MKKVRFFVTSIILCSLVFSCSNPVNDVEVNVSNSFVDNVLKDEILKEDSNIDEVIDQLNSFTEGTHKLVVIANSQKELNDLGEVMKNKRPGFMVDIDLSQCDPEVFQNGMGGHAFEFWHCLRSIKFPEGLRSLPVFNSWGIVECCDNLEEVYLPDSIEEIGNWTFRGCLKLKNIKLPKNLKKIGNWAFSETGIESLTIPQGVSSIGCNNFHRYIGEIEIMIKRIVFEDNKATWQVGGSKEYSLEGKTPEEIAEEFKSPDNRDKSWTKIK